MAGLSTRPNHNMLRLSPAFTLCSKWTIRCSLRRPLLMTPNLQTKLIKIKMKPTSRSWKSSEEAVIGLVRWPPRWLNRNKTSQRHCCQYSACRLSANPLAGMKMAAALRVPATGSRCVETDAGIGTALTGKEQTSKKSGLGQTALNRRETSGKLH